MDKQSHPVLLIHGMWSTGETLIELQKSLENSGYQVFAPTLPFHLPRTQHSEETKQRLARASLSEYLEFLVDFCKVFEKPPIVIGHSMGGILAQMLSTRLSTHRLILISSAPPAGILNWTWSVVRSFGHNMLKFPLWRKTTEIGIQNIRYGIANTQTAEIQQDLASKVTYESGMAATELGLWFAFRNPQTRINPTDIECPILILSGEEDRITPPIFQKKMKRKYGKQATLSLLSETCHWTVGGSNLSKVVASINNWLELKEVT